MSDAVEQNPERERRAGRPPTPEANEPVADARGSDKQPGADASGSDRQLDADASGSVPLAYLITFRTYGTWLHGDDRGSVDRQHNAYGTPLAPPDAQRANAARRRCKHASVLLNEGQRAATRDAIVAVCEHRQWTLHELNVRANHVHVVVSAPRRPDHVRDSFKSWSTRGMRAAGLIDTSVHPWATGGSGKYLWKPEQVEAACRYVLDGQGADL